MAGLTSYYAAALFELASEHGVLEECLTQAAYIKEALQTEKGLGVIAHPHLSRVAKRAFIDAILPVETHEDLIGILHMLIAERQENLIDPVLTAFISKGTHQDDKEKVIAHIISATVLKESQVSDLVHVLTIKCNKKVELFTEVDPSLIGGFCVYVNGLVIDCTVKKQLEDLHDTIKKVGSVWLPD